MVQGAQQHPVFALACATPRNQQQRLVSVIILNPFCLSFVLLAGAKLPGLLGLQSIKSEPILSIKQPTSNRYTPRRLFALQVELYQVPV